MAAIKATFKDFASKGNCTEATTKDVTRWLTDAKVIGKNNSSNNLDIAFSKVKTKGKSVITADQMVSLVKEIAPKYGMDKKIADKDAAEKELSEKLADCKKQTHGTTGVSKTGGVAKMTDTKQYTGAHKERFDETGKGKGAEGRSDKADNTGYVGNYKGEGTYDKK